MNPSMRFRLYCTLPGQSVRMQHALLSSVLGVDFHFLSRVPAPVAHGFQPQGASEAGLSFRGAWQLAWSFPASLWNSPSTHFRKWTYFYHLFFYHLFQARGSQALCAALSGLSSLPGCHQAVAVRREVSRGVICPSEAACEH